MALADKYFKEEINKILTEGFNDKDYEVRPKWPDGTPAHTIKSFCAVRRYDLSKEFPALTLRTQAFKGVVRELLWMWQMENAVKVLAGEDGTDSNNFEAKYHDRDGGNY